MLIALKISNIAIIEDLEMELTEGLNVLTGETGAGKSIILDALGLVLGNRAIGDLIRTGQKRAIVQAVFYIQKTDEVNTVLKDSGIEMGDDRILILTRELNSNGRHLCRINGQIVPLGLLKEMRGFLVDIHSQHEQQSLLTPIRQRELLDSFGGEQSLLLLEKHRDAYREWQAKVKELARQESDVLERTRRMEHLEFQIEEIKGAGLNAGEEEELIRERLILNNAEKIASLLMEAYRSIYEGEVAGMAAVELLGRAVKSLEELCLFDGKMEPFYQTLESTLYQIEDVARELKSYYDGIEFNPDRLNAIEQRLVDIKSLKRKYGNTVEEVIDYYRQAVAESDNLKNFSQYSEKLHAQIDIARKRWLAVAEQLSEARLKAARKLEGMIVGELVELNMNKVKFKIVLNKKNQPSLEGLEDVEFLLSPNPGEPLKPLAKIASGGELSRIILAMKTILAGVDHIPTIVFDEVDTGVGGSALQSIAQKMIKISKERQVLCITHAAQVACYAQTHYRIDKKATKDSTAANIQLLDKAGQINELARMLGGNETSALTQKHAQELYEIGAKTLPFQNPFTK